MDSLDMAKKRNPSDKAPAYQWYPKDYESDTDVICMTGLQEYAYRRLLDRQWLDGSIHPDPRRIALMVPKCGPVEYFISDIWPLLSEKFVPREDGRLVNRRLERHRSERSAFIQEMSDNGTRGAEARWGGDDKSIATPSQNDGQAIATPSQKNASPISVSDLQSPSRESTAPIDDSPQGTHAGELAGDADLQLSKRAAHFCDAYAALFKKHRHGAIYHSRRRGHGFDDDYHIALGLCATFDSERLARLVAVFLMTDDPYICKTDRGMAVFERKVSWCDDRLRLVEAKADRAKFPRSA